MFDLNDVWRAFDLKASKRPSEWRNKDRVNLEGSGDLRSVNGNNGSTYATRLALYAYAAWVSFNFYRKVFEAFNALTEGNLEEAKRIADKYFELRNTSLSCHMYFYQ